MSNLYIKQNYRNYFVYSEQGKSPMINGNWSRKKGLHSNFYSLDNELMLNIRIGKCPWIGGPTSYLFDIKDYSTIEVELKNRWKRHYDFYIDSNHYVLYEHYGHKRSLYKNGNQVAMFDKAEFNWGERDSGFATFNSDENIYLILGLWIMKDMGELNGSGASVDFGNLISGPMDWNEYWTPSK